MDSFDEADAAPPPLAFEADINPFIHNGDAAAEA
jgi:hypothetical protein